MATKNLTSPYSLYLVDLQSLSIKTINTQQLIQGSPQVTAGPELLQRKKGDIFCFSSKLP